MMPMAMTLSLQESLILLPGRGDKKRNDERSRGRLAMLTTMKAPTLAVALFQSF